MKIIKRLILLFLVISAACCAFRVFQDVRNDRFVPISYKEEVLKYSELYGVDPVIVFSVIRCESAFKADAESNRGAKGLMQIIPSTFNWLASLLNENPNEELIFDPETNIKYGTYYLKYLFNRFGNWDHVFAAYNAGENRVALWLKDERYSENGILTYIPFKETREYVKKVNDTILKYKEKYENEEWIK